jgi:UDP-GlcNAc:undecaprenyl-phosphate/decaprenyl-phosphate GlcNAc-1-phosphate transferase
MTTLNLTLVALGAFAIVIAGIPAVMKMCAHWGIYDQPGPLKIHAKPTPRLGGVAVALGLAISVGAAGAIAGFDPWPLLACIAILALVGVTDDARGTSPFTRLAVQVAVGIYLGASGYAIALTNSSIANVLIAAAVVVTFINAFNFLDGSDGVAACVTLATALTFIATGAASLSALLGASAWALAGCSAAFLLFNWPPARIFLGDSGSTVIGLVVAVLTLEYVRCLPSYAHPSVSLFPFAVAAVPLADAAFAIARRATHRIAPTSGDRAHFYDLWAQRGMTSRSIALAAFFLSAFSGVVAWIATKFNDSASLVVLGAYAVALIAAGVWLGSFTTASAETQPRETRSSKSAPTPAPASLPVQPH